LTEGRLQRWLPTVLRGFVEDKRQVLEDGFQVAPEVTEDLVLAEAKREVEQSHYSVLIQDMPPALWTPRVVGWLEGVVGRQDISPEERGRLLRLLAGRAGVAGVRTAEQVVIAGPGTAAAEDAMHFF
jgi:hypothetical protein